MSQLDSTEAELTSLGAMDTVDGQSAIALASAIDSGRSLMALPSMVKELRAVMTTIRERVPQEDDSVDDIAAQRAKRRAAQG